MAYLFWNLKIHYQVQKVSTLGPVQSQMNPVRILMFYLLRLAILSFHICLCLPSYLGPSGIWLKSSMHFSPPTNTMYNANRFGKAYKS
jgi:hypothetical protein